jgi:hypothetical protein
VGWIIHQGQRATAMSKIQSCHDVIVMLLDKKIMSGKTGGNIALMATVS